MIAVFDLDHTLLRKNISHQFGRFLYQKGYLSTLDAIHSSLAYLAYKNGYFTLDRLHQSCFRKLFQGKCSKYLFGLAEIFLEQKLQQLLHPVLLNRLQIEQKAGNKIILLSSSPDFLVERVGKYLKALHSKGTHYEVDKNGKMSAVGAVMDGSRKLQVLKTFNNKMYPYAVYTDSSLDLPLFQEASAVYLVKPSKRLAKMAVENQWEVITV